MRAKLAGLNNCAVPFLSRAASTCAGTIVLLYSNGIYLVTVTFKRSH